MKDHVQSVPKAFPDDRLKALKGKLSGLRDSFLKNWLLITSVAYPKSVQITPEHRPTHPEILVTYIIVQDRLILYVYKLNHAVGLIIRRCLVFDRRSKLLPVDNATAAGAAIYSRFTLLFYDFVVTVLENRFVYNLPTSLTLEYYNKHVTEHHMEIGVGSGYFLDKCTFPSTQPSITLLDLNRDCLETTSRRLCRYEPEQTQQNILEPLQLNGVRFDSIGLNYVLHCLPGTMLEKAVVFENIQGLLSDDGVVFGTTVLGRNVEHSRAEKSILLLYNRLGILSNWEDDAESLQAILGRYFNQYSVQIKGRCIAFFEARGSVDGLVDNK